jgi:CRISPR-associated protein Cas7/Cst2/DevR subtype I-B
MSETPTTAFGITSLSHVSLGNHNAGEGGSQLADLKTVGNRPYISGQAYRHAIKDALKGLTEEGVDCTPDHACGEIGSCKMCDLFGYFNPEELGEEVRPKRVSPLRVTPLEGQYDMPVTTDMILQFGVEDEAGDLDPNIGYRELTENVYKNAVSMDVDAIGRREIERVRDEGAHFERELKNELSGDDARRQRVTELIEALQNASQLAGQARHMADFMPDLMIATAIPTYNQRITNALHVDSESQTVDTNALASVLTDLSNMGAKTWVAGTHNPDVIDNWDSVFDTATGIEGVEQVDSITGCYGALSDHFEQAL